MKIPREAASLARRIFRMCLVEGRLDEDRLRRAVKKVLGAKPRHYQAVLHDLLRLTRVELERREVTIESAAELHKKERKRVEENLHNQYGNDLNFTYKINPELVGGMRIRVGDDVWDGSVKARLQRLKNAF